MNPIKSQIEGVEKEITGLSNHLKYLDKTCQCGFCQEDFKPTITEYQKLQIKLQTLTSLEPLFEKMEKEIQSLRTKLNKMEKK